MNPFEAWQIYQQNSEAPQAFIDFAFYFAVGAACERRVWVKLGEMQAFPNSYVVLVGPPGVGKGISINPALSLFRKFRTKFRKPGEARKESHVDANIAKYLDEEILDPYEMAIPIGPDSATLPAIVDLMPNLLRPIMDSLGKYHGIQTSLLLGLEELTTFIRKEDESIKDFLLKAYECGHYQRKLKTSYCAPVTKMCINFIAGTTPEAFSKVLKTGLLDDGFCARAWFIYADRKKRLVLTPEETEEQRQARIEVLAFIEKIIGLIGEIKYTPEAWAYFKDWYENKSEYTRINPAPVLSSYYGRIKIHHIKMTIIQKLIEEPNLNPIEIRHVIRAADIFAGVEPSMHRALVLTPRNELSTIAKSMALLIRVKGFATPGILWKTFTDQVTQQECQQIMLDMVRQGQWKTVKKDEDLGFALNGTELELVSLEPKLIDLTSTVWRK